MILEQKQLYFVFEFLDSDLAELLSVRRRERRGPLPIRDIQRCMHQILDALCFMHKLVLNAPTTSSSLSSLFALVGSSWNGRKSTPLKNLSPKVLPR
jgi:serine/threonine protein kinase